MNSANINFLSFWAYLQLMRPANIVTAWADILAGFAVSGTARELLNLDTAALFVSLAWLLLATTGLYAGGVVFNDVCDAELDAQERPERPIPSGRVSCQGATLLVIILFILAIVASFQVSAISGILAVSIVACAVLYDSFSKHHSLIGSLNMGLCRGGNLLLGMSVLPTTLNRYWFLSFLPIVYIGSITFLSQGEVHGGKRSQSWIAILLLGVVIIGFLGLGLLPNYQLLTTLPFIAFFCWQTLRPFIRAVHEPTPNLIRIAVKTGVLSLIVLNAIIAGGFGNWIFGCIVLSLLPLSIGLAQKFAVT